MTRARRFLALSAALALGACAGDSSSGAEEDTGADAALDAGQDTRPAGPSVVVGTGFPDYEPVAEGDRLMFTYGIQGGFHLWGGFRATGLAPDNVSIDFELRHDGEVIGVAFYTDRLTEIDDEGAYLYGGVAVAVTAEFQDRLRIPDEILAQDDRLNQQSGADFEEGPVQMWVRVADAEGRVVESEVDVTAACCVL